MDESTIAATASAALQETTWFQELSSASWITGLLLIPLALLVATVVNWILRRWLKRITEKTPTPIDDAIVESIRMPLFWTLVIIGVLLALIPIGLSDTFASYVNRGLVSVALWLWTLAGVEIVEKVVNVYGKDEEGSELIVEKGRLEFAGRIAKVLIYSLGIVIILITWGINLTPLLASLGIVAAALTIAAQDSIANVVGGISVMVTQPYKIGDYVDLPDGGRGEVTEIGMYNTRIKTRDNILVTIPNALMTTDAVVNETGFDSKLRVRIPIWIAYGSDLKEVKRVLLDVAKKRKIVLKKPAPNVRYREFGDNAIKVELRVVIAKPAWKGRVTDGLIMDIEKRFKKEGIVISPPSQQEVFLHEMGKKMSESKRIEDS